METVRAFIAVEIGDDIRARLDELQRKLKKVHADVRWVRPRNIHLTLAFLGELPADKTAPLETALDGALFGLPPFELAAVGTGFFGRPNHPRVIWTGLADCPPLMALRRKTVDAIQAAAIEFDGKLFSPHLTLGRVKGSNHTASLLEKLDMHKNDQLGQAYIRSVELIRSDLKPGGAEYTVLHRSPLSSE